MARKPTPMPIMVLAATSPANMPIPIPRKKPPIKSTPPRLLFLSFTSVYINVIVHTNLNLLHFDKSLPFCHIKSPISMLKIWTLYVAAITNISTILLIFLISIMEVDTVMIIQMNIVRDFQIDEPFPACVNIFEPLSAFPAGEL